MPRLGAMLKREIPPTDLVAHAQRHQTSFDELWVVEDLPPLTLLHETHSAVTRLLDGHRVDTDGDYVKLRDVMLEFPPSRPPRVSLGVTGPRSLELSGAIATGTVLSEGHGPTEIESARDHIAKGAARAGRDADAHHLTVFAAFHIGDPDTMALRNPGARTSWEAVGDQPAAVVDQLAALVEAGVDTIVLNSLGSDIDGQLELVASDVLPALRR